MSLPLVSVIVATNRGGPFLGDALASVAEQTYPHWEAVVVDDGSEDPAEIDRIAERYDSVRVIHQANAGVSIARNVAIAAARGTLCAFLDDDDLWLPGRLAAQVAAMVDNPAAVLAYGRVGTIDRDGRRLVPPDQQPVEDIHELCRRDVVPQFQTVMIRRSVIERIGGFHSMVAYAEDLDFILRAAREGPFVFVDAEVAQYRLHADNVTRRWRELAESIRAVLRLHSVAPIARIDGTDRDLRVGRRRNRMFAAWSAMRAAREHIGHGAPLRAGRDLLWALWFAPDAPVVFTLRRLGRRRQGGNRRYSARSALATTKDSA